MRISWTREDHRRWVSALRLAAEPWLSEMLGPLGICPALAGAGDLFGRLRDEAAVQSSTWVREDEPAIAAAVGAALRRLAEASSHEDARSFQRWSRRHFVCRDAPISLYVWCQVLLHLQRGSNGLYDLILPPEHVGAAIARAASTVTDGRIASLEDRIRSLAPAPAQTDIEIGLSLPSQALAAIEVLHNEVTATALIQLAVGLPAEDRRSVSHWAEMQATALDIPADRLGADRFLSEHPVCADAPPAVLI